MMEDEYRLNFFLDNGFVRKICEKCKTPFWTLNKDAKTCGVAPCEEYEFIGNPITDRPYTMKEMRNAFISFFQEKGHTALSRYPTVARWRSDIYFTIASIADFQPHVTSGEVEPPANPLVISQPCIRFNDVDNVGKSGRHMTVFEMMGHHAFNTEAKEIYWKDKAMEMCHIFHTKVLGIPEKMLKYREDPWTGGGNAGPAMEVCAGGLELATLVFMTYRRDDDGDVEIKGERYSRMPIRVIDPGYGLERLVWASSGTPTVYDAVYPDIVKKVFDAAGITESISTDRAKYILNHYYKQAGLMDIDGESSFKELRTKVVKKLNEEGVDVTENELEELISPMEKAYAVVDHAKALAFMISDGAVPSNSKAGYMVRLLIRRSIRMLEDLGIIDTVPLMSIIDMHIDSLKEDYPDLAVNRSTIEKIIHVEEKRYTQTLEKGKNKVMALFKKYPDKIPIEEFALLYDSHGLHPGTVAAIAMEMGRKIDPPDNFLSYMAKLHAGENKTVKKLDPLDEFLHSINERGLEDTVKLYYEKDTLLEFESPVIYREKFQDTWGIVLKETAFYPEGGGQPADSGELIYGDDVIKVRDVRKVGNIVVHFIDRDIPIGKMVHGRVNKVRRMRHTRHHTSTHIILTAAKRVLGNHVWQTGSQLDEKYGRLDITHYQRLTKEEVREIERIANEIVLEDLPVEKSWLSRDIAEKKYGFTLYQGGPPISKMLRIVRIGHLDAQACGGTHINKTSDIGFLKIIHTERIQDGVERLEYAAGDVALAYVQEMEEKLESSADAAGVPVDKLREHIEAQNQEMHMMKKELEALRKAQAETLMENLSRNAKVVETEGGSVKIISHIASDAQLAKNISMKVSKEAGLITIVGIDGTARLMMARSEDIDLDLRKIINQVADKIGGKGGGKPNFVQAGGSRPEGLRDAISSAITSLEKALSSNRS